MSRIRKQPIVIQATILAIVVFVIATPAHTDPQDTRILLWVSGSGYFLFMLWPEIRTSPRVERLAKYWAKRRA